MRIDVEQARGHIVVQVVQVLRQFAAALEIEHALQADHDAAGPRQRPGLVLDRPVLDMASGAGQTVVETIEQHLDQLHVVRGVDAGDDLDGAVALHRLCISPHDFRLLSYPCTG